MKARPIVNRKPRSLKHAPKTTAIVPIRAEQQNALPTSQELPLGYLATASKSALQQFWINRLATAEGFQRAALEAIRAAITDTVAAELAKMAIDGVLEKVPTPRNAAAERADQQRAFLRIRAKEILQQENSDLEPFFRPRPLSDAILRECTLDHRRITKRVYIYQGCLRCRRKGREYGGAGFCKSCYSTIQNWRREVAKHPEVYDVH